MKKKLVLGTSAIVLALALLCGCGTKDDINPQLPENQTSNSSIVNTNDELQEEIIDVKEDIISEESGDIVLDTTNSGDVTNKDTTVPESEEVNSDINSTEISDNWLDFEFLLDGAKYKLGETSYNDLKNAGWTFDLADYGYSNGYILNPNDKSFSTIKLNNAKYGDKYNDFYITVGFINNDTVAKDITECNIWSIIADARYGSKMIESHSDMMITKGIHYGSTEEEVLTALGTPNDIYENSELGYKTFSWNYKYSPNLRITVYADTGVSKFELKKY